MKWEFLETLEGNGEVKHGEIRKRIFESIQKLIALRKNHPALAHQDLELIATGNPHTLAYLRAFESRMIVLANFSEHPQVIEGNKLRMVGLGRFFTDVISDQTVASSHDIGLEPYQVMWLDRR